MAELLDLLAAHTPLARLRPTKHGAEALCPWHHDTKLGSFFIHEAKGYAKCFSCKEFRPLFAFLLEQGVPLAEAIHYQFNFQPSEDRGTMRELQEYQLGYALPKSMLDRGFTPATLDYFGVGYDAQVPRGAGRTVGAITVPLRYEGKLYGIKYREYPEGFWFSDNFPRELFLYNYAPTSRRVYVEGETDTWRSHQNGRPEVAALLGSQVSEAQAALMALHEDVVLAFDNDEAGWQAIYQAYGWLRHTKANLWVALYKAEDPGACPAPEWQRAVDNPVPIVAFFIKFRNLYPEWHRKWATWENQPKHGK